MSYREDDAESTPAPATVRIEDVWRARLLMLADEIEAHPEGFHFSNWTDGCGTVACALGRAVLMFGAECGATVGSGTPTLVTVDGSMTGPASVSARLFGMIGLDHELLFMPLGYGGRTPTADVMVARLREYARGIR